VLDGDPASLPKRRRSPGPRGGAPQFSAHVYCGQSAGWIKMALGKELGLGPVHIVLDGDTSPLPAKRGQSPQFLAHLCCGQTAAWIKMPLGTEVGLGLRNIVLDVDAASSREKGIAAPPPFVYCGHGRPSQLLLSSC